MHNFQLQLNDSALLPIFEIEVTDNEDHTDYVICDISVRDNQLVAQRDAVSTEEKQARYIAKTVVDIDGDFTLEWHLEMLLEAINYDIIDGDLYNFSEAMFNINKREGYRFEIERVATNTALQP